MILNIGKGILNRSKLFYFDSYNLGKFEEAKDLLSPKVVSLRLSVYLVRIGVFCTHRCSGVSSFLSC